MAHAIMLRSHKLQDSDVPLMCRGVVRCGAGTNNCNVARMTELGIPVFNTPGANANSAHIHTTTPRRSSKKTVFSSRARETRHRARPTPAHAALRVCQNERATTPVTTSR